jgi:hypothetical protein
MPPPGDDSTISEEVERGRLEMERNWQLRQENVLPLETAWNEGRFYELLLKGGRPLSGVQRVGIFVLGLLEIGVPSVTLALERRLPLLRVGPSLKSIYQRLPDVSLLSIPILVLYFAVGFRFCWVALKGSPRRTDTK